MPETFREWCAFVVGLCAVGALVALIAIHRTNGPDAAPKTTTATLQATTRAAVPAPAPAPVTTAPKAPARPLAQVRLLVSATRGDSWLVVRKDSATGTLLFQGTLAQGRTVRAAGSRFWLRVGAGANLDLAVNGRAARLGAGTFDAVLTRSGIQQVP